MSFLKSLFGRRSSEAAEAPKTAKEVEYQGFLIRAEPYKEGGQYQTAGVIEKEVGGVKKEHRFVRADRFGSLEEAADFAITKGQQIIDQQGERCFS